MGDYPAMLVAPGSRTGIAIFPPREDSSAGEGARILHIAFRVSGEAFAQARAALAARGIETDFQDHDVSHSIYFDDPDGNRLELTTYEVR